MTTAAIVIIGDEILTGKFVEENAAFLVGELRALGVDLLRITVIPDDREDIASTVIAASARFDHVFTSGGVGPTHDDITIAAIAHGFGVAVVREPDLERRVRAYWGDRLAEANLRLADVPAGAQLVYGDGSDPKLWPVVCMKNVYILPGVPALFRRKFTDIRDRFRAVPVATARLYLDAEEGDIAADLDAVVAAHPAVKIGSYPRFGERIGDAAFKVIITFEGASATEVAAARDALAARLGGAPRVVLSV